MQKKITDFIGTKEKQLPSCESNLTAEQQSNGEFVRGVNNVKRRKK
jgi:hypothetical protein